MYTYWRKEKKEILKRKKRKLHKKPYVKIELLHPLGFKYDLWSLIFWVDWDEMEWALEWN